MKVIIDEREHSLIDQCNTILNNSDKLNIELSTKLLPLGDIVIHNNDNDIIIIERKTLSDLISSIKDGRYEEQSYRLLNSSGLNPHSIIYVIEGLYSQVTNPTERKMVISAITSLNYFKGFSVYRTNSVIETSDWLLNMANKINIDLLKGKSPYCMSRPYLNYFANSENTLDSATNEPPYEQPKSTDYCDVVKKVKKDNVTPENISHILLCQIPGISSTTAKVIMNNFTNFSHLINELKLNNDCLYNLNLTYNYNGKTRKISKTCVENIKKYLI